MYLYQTTQTTVRYIVSTKRFTITTVKTKHIGDILLGKYGGPKKGPKNREQEKEELGGKMRKKQRKLLFSSDHDHLLLISNLRLS